MVENKDVTRFDRDELEILKISNKFADAEISLFGAHILKFKPKNSENIIFLSKKALFSGEKAIRGGVPICFPWFAGGTTGDASPAHGFARISIWNLENIETLKSGATKLSFSLNSSNDTKQHWPYDFKLLYEVTVGESLDISLTCTNLSKRAFDITQALHSYFRISDVSEVIVTGFEDTEFIDSIDKNIVKSESAPIKIDGEIDRIYKYCENSYQIKDSQLNRTINISKSGSHSTVLWNPWIDKSKSLKDFGDSEYKEMVCIETANAGGDIVTIKPNESHSLKTTISLID